MSERALRTAVASTASGGAAIAGYLVYVRFAGGAIACTNGGCELVQSSRYAELLGVPVALLGLIAYLSVLATACVGGEAAAAAGASVALAGAGFGAYLLVVQLAVLDAFCEWCVASDVAMTVAAILGLLRLLGTGTPRPVVSRNRLRGARGFPPRRTPDILRRMSASSSDPTHRGSRAVVSAGSAATRNLTLATLAFAFCFSAWSLIAPFAKSFKADLGLSYTQALLLTAVPVVLGSLLRIPFGYLTDRHGGRTAFALLLAFSALPSILFGYAHAYWALIAVGFLLGVAGASFAIGVPFVSGWYGRERQGFALGVYGMGNVGTAVALFGAPPIANHWGRTTVGWVTGIALLAFAAVFWLLARDAPGERAPARYGDVVRSGWRLYRLAFFYFITFGGFVAMGFLLPTLLQDWFGYSKGEAGMRAAGFIVAATLARPAGGWIADRSGAFSVLVLAFAGVAVDAAVLAALAPTPRIVPISIACLTLGVFLGAGNGAVFKLVPAEFPDSPGAAAGVVGAAGGLGGFFPPIFVGLVKDAEGTYTYGFVGLLVFVVACLALAVWLIRTAPPSQLRGVET